MNLATSLAILILLGLSANYIFNLIKLPGLLGMLLLGVLLGPFGLNWLSEDLLRVSEDFRKIALIIILLRAGLGIKRDDINKVGRTAIKLSSIPCLLEGITIAFLATRILGITWIEGGILGFVLAAVSPAVIVPSMLKLIEEGVGAKKSIPTLVLAAASVDDIFAITLFSAFLGLYGGNSISIVGQLMGIPISIVLGVLLGVIVGSFFVYAFSKYHIRDTKKLLIILGVAILFTAIEELVKIQMSGFKIEIAGLLGVMTVGFILLEKKPDTAKRLAAKFNKVWVFAEILLFVLVGAQVNTQVALEAGILGLVLLFGGLLARAIGVLVSTFKTGYTWREKLFIIIAYMPKATVQAAIGALAREAGVPSGETILAIAVLSILVTAPIGAIGINLTGKKWLDY